MTVRINCTADSFLPFESIEILQGNFKSLSEANYKKLRKQILDNGIVSPIHVWPNDGKHSCLDGTQRLRTLKQMQTEGYSIPDVPVTEIQAPDLKTAKKILMSLASQYGEVVGEGFMEFISDMGFSTLKEVDDSFRFPELDFDALGDEFLKDHTDKTHIEDDMPGIPKKPKAKLGDIYKLGEHRLMCGDSTDNNMIEKLMDGERADMVFTDPPYGMSVVKPDGNTGGYRKGSVGWKSGTVVGKSRLHRAKVGVYRPIIGDDKPYDPTHLMGLADIKIIWGANHFSDKLPCSPHWIVWNKEMPAGVDFSGAELAWSNVDKKAVKVFKHVWAGMTRQGSRADELSKRVHPTQKPVGLFADILNHYDPKTVVDVFGGGGSTLIACEKTNRKCFMMELDPHYIDVIVERWENYTGKKAELLNPIVKLKKKSKDADAHCSA